MYSWLDLWMRSWFVLMAHHQYIVSVLNHNPLKHIDIKREPWNGLFSFPHDPGSGECCALFDSSLSRCLFLSLFLPLLLLSSASSEWYFCNEMVKCILDYPSLFWRVGQSEQQSCYPLARLFENYVDFFLYKVHACESPVYALVITW